MSAGDGRVGAAAIRGSRADFQHQDLRRRYRWTDPYITGLHQLEADGVGDIDYAMLEHLGVLIGRAVRDSEVEPVLDRQRDAIHRQILAEIEASLSDACLCAEDLAHQLRISRSHLYAVLSEKGTTFAGLLRERRLACERQREYRCQRDDCLVKHDVPQMFNIRESEDRSVAMLPIGVCRRMRAGTAGALT